MNRRQFFQKALSAGTGLAVLPTFSRVQAGSSTRLVMRLDSHIHIVPHGKNIVGLGKYMKREDITHAAVFLEHDDLALLPRLQKLGPGVIIFDRLRRPLEQHIDPRPDSPVLGYKIHLRKPVVTCKDGRFLAADDAALDRLYGEAEDVARPLVFHSDADDPKLCTLPQIANAARRHPGTSFIAAHVGAFSQEYQGDKMSVEQWQSLVPGALAENIGLLLDVKNLYADTAILGRDFPERTPDPEEKLDLVIRELGRLAAAEKSKLQSKLFIGTDYPWFYKPKDPRGGYRFQRDCAARVFGDDFNETRITKNFLKLLPGKG